MHTRFLDLIRVSCFSIGLLLLTSVCGVAATGDELLMSAIDGVDLNKGAIPCEKLVKAVSKLVAANPNQAPEIVAAAVLKNGDCAKCGRALVTAAIKALGQNKLKKGLVPRLVSLAIQARPNSCECASVFTAAAIDFFGENPPEELIADILREALAAASPDCAARIVDAATNSAPQFADTLADIGARYAKGEITPVDNTGILDANGRPVPAPFVFPSTGGGGISAGEVTPVN